MHRLQSKVAVESRIMQNIGTCFLGPWLATLICWKDSCRWLEQRKHTPDICNECNQPLPKPFTLAMLRQSRVDLRKDSESGNLQTNLCPAGRDQSFFVWRTFLLHWWVSRSRRLSPHQKFADSKLNMMLARHRLSQYVPCQTGTSYSKTHDIPLPCFSLKLRVRSESGYLGVLRRAAWLNWAAVEIASWLMLAPAWYWSWLWCVQFCGRCALALVLSCNSDDSIPRFGKDHFRI